MYSGRRRPRGEQRPTNHITQKPPSRYNRRMDPEVLEATPENLRIEIDHIFKEFLTNSDASEYIFPANLNRLQRKYIHEKAQKMNLSSRSHGSPPDRRLHIRKKPKSPWCQSFCVSPGTATLDCLRDFFTKTSANCPEFQAEPARSALQDFAFGKLTEVPGALLGLPNTPVGLRAFKDKLPVSGMRAQILHSIAAHQVLILSSETGSGKTTQIPQFIMEDMASRELRCKVICTQPRRLSTVSVAQRVAEERGELVGESVGYQIRLEQKYGLNTGLIYCTNGVLLRSLMGGARILKTITHIIVDEVHERDRLSDFLLICIKQNLHKFPHLRVILMSATVDVDKFQRYFANAAVMSLPGRQFPIQEFFLDEILPTLKYMSPAMERIRERGVEEGSGAPETTSICEYQNCSMDMALENYANCDGEYLQQSTQIALYLLSEDVSVDYQHSQTGMTPLMMAAAFGDEELLTQLLGMKANVYIQSRCGKTALDYAIENNQDSACTLIKYHMNGGDKYNPSSELLTLYDKTQPDEQVDYDLLVALLMSIHNTNQDGAVLIFLPGYDDIMICNDRIMDSSIPKNSFRTFFLHGSMNIRDQHDVFKHLPRNVRKIILSTNIAETSVTIDDVVFVVDCGLAKEKSYDSYNRLSSLQTTWISQACVKQRSGRAGRTGPGMCFHLFSRQRFSNMSKERVPEILRVSLEELCLHTKILAPRNTDILQFFEQAPDPPTTNLVKVAIENLQALGALDAHENLTKLGEYLLHFTIEPRLAKMLIYASIFRCLEPILTLTACLANKDPFQLPPQANLKTAAAERRRSLTNEVPSDHLIYLKAFIKWQEEVQRGRAMDFCREYFVSKSAMEAILELRRQLLSQLRASGFVAHTDNLMDYNRFADNWPLVKAMISVGYYPHIAFPNGGTTYSTKQDKKVYIVHTSALSKVNLTTWIVFDELIKNKHNFALKGCTAVAPMAVSLLCGNKTEPVSENTFMVDQWLEIESTTGMMLRFRKWTNYLVNRVFANPSVNYDGLDHRITNTLQQVLRHEDATYGLVPAHGIGSKPHFLHYTDRAQRHRHADEHQFQAAPPRHNQGRRNQQQGNRGVDQISRSFQNLSVRPHFDGRLVGNEDPDRKVVYLLVKPRQIHSVVIAYKKETWVFAPQTEKKILSLHMDDVEVRLLFSVHSTNAIQGIAKYMSISQGYGKPTAKIRWIANFQLSNERFRHLFRPQTSIPPVYDGNDGDIVERSVADELLRIYREYDSRGFAVNGIP